MKVTFGSDSYIQLEALHDVAVIDFYLAFADGFSRCEKLTGSAERNLDLCSRAP
jgi:hypothetical protein